MEKLKNPIKLNFPLSFSASLVTQCDSSPSPLNLAAELISSDFIFQLCSVLHVIEIIAFSVAIFTDAESSL
jgi:hypothetical protein